jgi:hypothetical protein
MPLSPKQIERYSRQLLLKGWPPSLQSELLKCSVAVPADLRLAPCYLSALGFGRVLIYGDEGESANSQRFASHVNAETQVEAATAVTQPVDFAIVARSTPGAMTIVPSAQEQIRMNEAANELEGLLAVSQIIELLLQRSRPRAVNNY